MKSVALTEAENDPWLMLTLDEPRQIGEVEIFADMENLKAFSEHGVVEGINAEGNVIFTGKAADSIDKHVVEAGYKGMSG